MVWIICFSLLFVVVSVIVVMSMFPTQADLDAEFKIMVDNAKLMQRYEQLRLAREREHINRAYRNC